MSYSTSLRLGACAILFLAITQFSVEPVDAQPPGRLSPKISSTSGETKVKFTEPLSDRDLSKFRGYQSEEIPPGWKIDGKHLFFDGSGIGDIMTKETYGDFELQVDWKIEEGGNSGIMFRVTPGDEEPFMSGPEIQILDDEAHDDGKSELTSAGALYGLYPATDKSLRKVGGFNNSRIVVEGNKITHYLNSKKVLEAEIGSEDWNKRLAESKFKDWEKFAKSSSGHICFQNHGDPVRFRNIRIKRLGDATDAEQEEGKAAGRGSVGGPPGQSQRAGQAGNRGTIRGRPPGVGDRRGQGENRGGGGGK